MLQLNVKIYHFVLVITLNDFSWGLPLTLSTSFHQLIRPDISEVSKVIEVVPIKVMPAQDVRWNEIQIGSHAVFILNTGFYALVRVVDVKLRLPVEAICIIAHNPDSHATWGQRLILGVWSHLLVTVPNATCTPYIQGSCCIRLKK